MMELRPSKERETAVARTQACFAEVAVKPLRWRDSTFPELSACESMIEVRLLHSSA